MDNFPDVDETPKPLGEKHGNGFNARHFELPSLPGKIIKEGWDIGNDDQEKIDREINASEDYLAKLATDYGIIVAPHYFVVGPSFRNPNAGQVLFCIQDRIQRSRPLDALIGNGDDEALQAGAILTGRLLDHVDDVIRNGGSLEPEFFRYNQYVLQSARVDPVTRARLTSLSERLVLVDTEPFVPLSVLASEERHKKDDFSTIVWALEICAGQVMELKAHGRGEYTAHYLLSLVDSLPDSDGLKRVKDGFKDCIQQGDYEMLDTFLEEEFPYLF